MMFDMRSIVRPSFVVHRERAAANIHSMAEKCRTSGVSFRPHFKTHQSYEVGKMYREEGVRKITVSSVRMAEYFADDGWDDITIAFPVNLLEIGAINKLASRIQLSVILDDPGIAVGLSSTAEHPMGVWIEVDTGYNRTGIAWNDSNRALDVLSHLKDSTYLHFLGLLCHSGHSYHLYRAEERRQLYNETVQRMHSLREAIADSYSGTCLISSGDTPCFSTVEELPGIDEARPGNFVFNDLQQYLIGSCREEQIAGAVVCPVVGVYPDRGEAVLYGGAVHLSKQGDKLPDGSPVYGFVCSWNGKRWGQIDSSCTLASLSQEHGTVRFRGEVPFNVGDLVAVIPVHSCLAMNLLQDSVYII